RLLKPLKISPASPRLFSQSHFRRAAVRSSQPPQMLLSRACKTPGSQFRSAAHAAPQLYRSPPGKSVALQAFRSVHELAASQTQDSPQTYPAAKAANTPQAPPANLRRPAAPTAAPSRAPENSHPPAP